MTTGHVFIAASVDGYIARPDDDIDWLAVPGSEDEDHGYDDFISGIDGILMGRGTYQKVKSFGEWPYPVPVHVLSATLSAKDLEPGSDVTLGRETPEDAMRMCRNRGWRRVYVDGGRIIQAFLAARLIEDLVLTRIPVLLGKGKPLFGATHGDIRLKHLWSRDFPSGLTQSKYQIGN